MKFHKSRWRNALLGTTLAGAAAIAQAGTFNCISGFYWDCNLAESTLSWAWNGLDFTISNSGDGYVSEVYFDLSPGMSVSYLSGVGNVSFSLGASPPSLPGGNSVGFVSDTAFDSGSGSTKGIDKGESATFRVAGTSGTLEAGLHVRSLFLGGSASLVSPGVSTTVVTPVPEPETYAMMLAGFGLVAWAARSRRKA